MALFFSILVATFGTALTLASDEAFQVIGVLLIICGAAGLYVWLVCRRAQTMSAAVRVRAPDERIDRKSR